MFLCAQLQPPHAGFKDHHQEALGRWQQEATAAQSDFNGFLNSGSVADSHVDDNSSSSSSSSHVDDNSSSSSCHNIDSAANTCQAGGQGKELADVEQIRSSRLAQAVVATAAQLVGADPARPSFGGTRFSQPEEDSSGSCSSSSELVGHSGPDFVNMAPSSRRRLQSSGAGSVAGTSCSTRRPAVQSSPQDVQHRVTSARQVDKYLLRLNICQMRFY